jgi:lipid II:glycine glycyltransferase (peptidoglycan interpeptide bridge formation enzyme)
MMKLLLAKKAGTDGDQMRAGSVFLSFCSTVHYALTGCHSLAFTTHANGKLQWEAIHSAAQEGFRHYDFGRVVEERPELVRFKRKWCAKAVPLYRYNCPTDDLWEASPAGEPVSFRWAREIWHLLPLVMTWSCGRRIYARL